MASDSSFHGGEQSSGKDEPGDGQKQLDEDDALSEGESEYPDDDDMPLPND